MKKLLAIFLLMSVAVSAVEIFDEFYVMEKTISTIEKGEVYNLNGEKFKVTKVDNKILKSLSTTDNPFYFYNSNNEKTMARIGDYLVSPLTLSEIYSVDKNEFKNYIKE
ncbi:MAG: hypothetical protein SPJ84_08305 [Fusobacterium gastrosuis]|uniref:hypothetical protein n=1 Tax=Fusobacterium gastrosuis TaxID=1755100 RepID=UPI002A944A14|nr:hypothetical protein [Fusobacteriaceae bacterium]MDY5795812.1 hypothetical protein [Fusobacterium gastrosuis]